MITSLTIGGVTYDAPARIAARIHLETLTRTLQGYDDFAFSVRGGPPAPDWNHGTAVSVTIDFEQGAGPVLKFSGEITDRSTAPGPLGWTVGYTCQGMKYQADRVPITAPDLSGAWGLNLSPDDPLYAPADAGLNLGQIFTRVLKIATVANALAAVGVQYASLSPPTLHATTVSDLALLTIVPPQPVHLGGESILNILGQILNRWMPKYVDELRPDGVLRFKDTTDTATFVPRTLTLPSNLGLGDPGVEWPSIRSSTRSCATRLVLRGGQIGAVSQLSTATGTLEKAWSSADETAWRYTDFEQPKDSSDAGTVTSVTGNTALVTSGDSTKTAALNFWPGRQGVIELINTVASGIAVSEFRRITANTAQTAGASFTVTWDASQPLDATGYNKYRIVGQANSRADVGRLFNVREPHSSGTALLGLNTWIGAHLIVRSPIPLPWSNNSTSVQKFYAEAIVVGGTVPTEDPAQVEPLPGTGQFRLRQPDVAYHGNKFDLEANGYPTTTAKGKPTDVRILAIYSRGINQVTVPADISGVAQYQGTAFSAEGLQVTRTLDVPSYADQWDAVAMAALGQQHLDAIKDVVYEGTGGLLVEPNWDVLEFDYSLNYAIAGATSPWSGINAPARSVSITWPQGSGSRHHISFGFSTLRRPFSGDDLYLHPSFTGQSVLGQVEGLGLEAFAGMSITGGFQMPVGQDQGDFTAADLGITGRGNNFGGTGTTAGLIAGARGGMTEIAPETAGEADVRRGNQPTPMSRDRAMAEDAARRSEIQGRTTDRREAIGAREDREALAQEQRDEIARRNEAKASVDPDAEAYEARIARQARERDTNIANPGFRDDITE